MIPGFELETATLTAEEMDLAIKMTPLFANKVGKAKAVTSTEIIKGVRKVWGVKLSGARLRKIVNYIRREGLVHRLIATSNGYYVAETNKEFSDYINGLKARAGAIMEVAKQLEKQHLIHNGNK